MPKDELADRTRKEATIEAIIEATARLMKGKVESFPVTRQIAAKSGYSVGTIYNYFSSIGSVISHVVIKRQQATILRIKAVIDQHDSSAPVAGLCASVLEIYFCAFCAHDPRLVRFVFNTARLHADKPEVLDRAADALVAPLMDAIHRDKTDTFRDLSAAEILAFLRGTVFFVRNPLLEGSAFFGTPMHRQIVMDYMTRVFSKEPRGAQTATQFTPLNPDKAQSNSKTRNKISP